MLGRLIALGVLLITCKQALGWSDEAHIAICEIALLEVSPEIRQMINVLQKSEDNRNHADFSSACTWADQPPRKRRGEHFINVPRNQAEISGPDCPIGDKCLLTAIEEDRQTISGSDSSDKEKWEALKYLGHWVLTRSPGNRQVPSDSAGQLLNKWMIGRINN